LESKTRTSHIGRDGSPSRPRTPGDRRPYHRRRSSSHASRPTRRPPVQERDTVRDPSDEDTKA
jgi:hypothetical protein